MHPITHIQQTALNNQFSHEMQPVRRTNIAILDYDIQMKCVGDTEQNIYEWEPLNIKRRLSKSHALLMVLPAQEVACSPSTLSTVGKES